MSGESSSVGDSPREHSAPPEADPYVWWDGRYRYTCDLGHNVASRLSDLQLCPAPMRPVAGDLCGAEMAYRQVPLEPITPHTQHAKTDAD